MRNGPQINVSKEDARRIREEAQSFAKEALEEFEQAFAATRGLAVMTPEDVQALVEKIGQPRE